MQSKPTDPPTPPALVPPDCVCTPAPGLGTACAEAQADGVPCSESTGDCERCGRARKPHLNSDDVIRARARSIDGNGAA